MAMSVSLFAQSAVFADELVFSGEKETYVVLTETSKRGKESFQITTVKPLEVIRLSIVSLLSVKLKN